MEKAEAPYGNACRQSSAARHAPIGALALVCNGINAQQDLASVIR
jgi:hypothetical protein